LLISGGVLSPGEPRAGAAEGLPESGDAVMIAAAKKVIADS
jgi:hypothetical protein